MTATIRKLTRTTFGSAQNAAVKITGAQSAAAVMYQGESWVSAHLRLTHKPESHSVKGKP
jgi:hypothetical protein